MRYAIFSDIHGNLDALESVGEELKNESVDAYLCAGDVVGYGADPDACLSCVQDLGAICVAGNHEWAVAQRISTDDFSFEARVAIHWTRERLSTAQKTYLKDLPLIYENDDLLMVHGALPEPGTFPYLNDLVMANEMMGQVRQQVSFIGHTHAPEILCREGDDVRYASSLTLILEPRCQYLVNVGSVGQPRDGLPEACLCLFETETRRIEIRRVAYDIENAQAKILAAGLPKTLAARLMLGM